MISFFRTLLPLAFALPSALAVDIVGYNTYGCEGTRLKMCRAVRESECCAFGQEDYSQSVWFSLIPTFTIGAYYQNGPGCRGSITNSLVGELQNVCISVPRAGGGPNFQKGGGAQYFSVTKQSVGTGQIGQRLEMQEDKKEDESGGKGIPIPQRQGGHAGGWGDPYASYEGQLAGAQRFRPRDTATKDMANVTEYEYNNEVQSALTSAAKCNSTRIPELLVAAANGTGFFVLSGLSEADFTKYEKESNANQTLTEMNEQMQKWNAVYYKDYATFNATSPS